MAAGYGLVHKAEVGTTMDEARAHVMAGNMEPCWFVADAQTGGRGRHGRTWISPPGNLYATLALTAPGDPARAPELGFVAGLALYRAVAAGTGLHHPDLAIKWPNDLLLGGAKVAGLLLEGLQARGRFVVLIGFGVNVASAPQGLIYPTQALAAVAAAPTPAHLLRELSLNWIEAHARWAAGFARTRADWQELAHGLGADVRVRPPSGEVRGVMRGINARGCLLLDTPTGQVTIDAGDLFFGG
ncbi:MAG: biotin--[acetyl-CoA-carboxylase] ligase [Hyphomicrobiales bacterium]|nr:biotin--[acetyl-CoA-carboxylase] ligase [Hyphomicrobiales bacterium]